MTYNLSACVFIRNTFKGAFCLFESMATLLPLADEFIVMDLDSEDGTLETLRAIAEANPKMRLVNGQFTELDARVFATLANDLVAMCSHDTVLYYQADEIWHENLLKLTRAALNRGERDLSFWRVQLRHNFQKIKWFPHPVHRIAPKDDFIFVNDGMNTERTWSAKMISQWGFGQFAEWGAEFEDKPTQLPTNEMILDVSLTGGFLDNIPDRRRMHLPFWGEDDVMPADEGGMGVDDWYSAQKGDPNWAKTQSPFDLPAILKWHVGRFKYELRPELLEALKEDATAQFIDDLGKGDGWR